MYDRSFVHYIIARKRSLLSYLVCYRWWLQAAKQEGDKISKTFSCNTWKQRNERAQVLEVSLLGVGEVLRLETDAWSMVKWLRQATATNEYALPPAASYIAPAVESRTHIRVGECERYMKRNGMCSR